MPLETWPRDKGTERSQLILEAVVAGRYELEWCPLSLSDGQGTLHLMVSCDALKIDGVRVSVEPVVQQLIADQIGAVLLTPKLIDEIYRHTVPQNQLTPKPQPISSKTTDMIEYSRRVDEERDRRGAQGLLANVGKDWAIVRSIFSQSARAQRKAANYGWLVRMDPWRGINAESAVTPGLFALQGIGTAHNDEHTDYSQVGRFALRSARFGELPVDLADVYTGRAPGTSLVSHEGPLPDYRQPIPDNGFPPSEPPTLPSKKSGSSGGPVAGGLAGAVVGYAVGGIPGAAVGTIGGILVAARLRG